MSWDSLGQVMRENALLAEIERSRPPVDCPVHGWPLEQGRDAGQLHCVFGGDSCDLSGKPIFIW